MKRIPIPILVMLIAGCSTAPEVTTSTPIPATTGTTATAPTAAAATSTATTATSLPAAIAADSDSPCLSRAAFPDPAESEYILPFNVGDEYYLSQSYCTVEGSHEEQIAFDFDMPIGTEVRAARAGVVKTFRDDSADDGAGYGEHNYVFIQHEDGTVAFYAHLMQDGVLVDYGDEVEAGQLIAYSGNSGITGGNPHLHFGVYLDWPPREGRDVPVSFSNASGPRDARGGLVRWRLIEALPLDLAATALPTPNGVNPDSPCLERARFGDPSDSEYILPFHVGEEYYLSQSYCFSEGGHRDQLAYDFDMPIGAEVLAARAGVVKEVKEDSPDTGLGYGQHNYVMIQHEDGTVAFYAHLMMDGVAVNEGDQVEAGDFIGFSGNSGLTGGPHLHFGVYQSWPPHEGSDVPVNFRNASGQHDSRGGLAIWRLFEALPVD